MEQRSQLLEKSLVMTGEVIEANSVWQGGPVPFWFQHAEESTSLPYGVEETEEENQSEVPLYGESSKLLSGDFALYTAYNRWQLNTGLTFLEVNRSGNSCSQRNKNKYSISEL
jgi:hypothetical protein